MGYLFSHSNKESLVKELTTSTKSCEVLGSSLYGNQLWVLFRRDVTFEAIRYEHNYPCVLVEKKKRSLNSFRFICLFLLSKVDGQYGYKAIDEASAPAYYNCPQKFIKQSDLDTGFAKQWREEVTSKRKKVASNKARLRNMQYGDTVEVTQGYKVRFLGKYTDSFSQFIGQVLEGEQINKTFRFHASSLI